MKKGKNNKLFRLILLSLFIIYIGLYIANETGYYESKLNNKVRLTNESIRQFEKDVEYTKEYSFLLDMKILFMTVKTVFKTVFTGLSLDKQFFACYSR